MKLVSFAVARKFQLNVSTCNDGFSPYQCSIQCVFAVKVVTVHLLLLVAFYMKEDVSLLLEPKQRLPQADLQSKIKTTYRYALRTVGSAVHMLRTCLFTDTHSLTHSYIPDDIVGGALYSALPTKTKHEKLSKKNCPKIDGKTGNCFNIEGGGVESCTHIDVPENYCQSTPGVEWRKYYAGLLNSTF